VKPANDYRKLAFSTALLLLLYVFYLMAKPYLTYALLGLILGTGFYPLYKWLQSRLKWEKASALATVLAVLVIIIIPSIIIIRSLYLEIIYFFSNGNITTIQAIVSSITEWFGQEIDVYKYLNDLLTTVGRSVAGSTIGLIGSVTEAAIGLLIMFSIMYYSLTGGKEWAARIEAFLPLEEDRKARLAEKIHSVIKTVLNVEITIAVLQGALGGIAFYMAGIPNPFFWGFVMALLAFLPFVGTGMVWVPAAIIKIVNNEFGWGIFLLIYGVLAIGGIDYLLRPKLVSGKSGIHPVTALIGAFGGLKLFGFPGLIIGPLIAATLEVLITFQYEDYSSIGSISKSASSNKASGKNAGSKKAKH
jgi:predicted PurR-regulated permease PerM